MATVKKKVSTQKVAPKSKPKPEKVEIVEAEIVPISEREAPVERQRILSIENVIEPVFNQAQLRILLNQTPKWAIKVRQGPGGNYRYVPHGYVTDTLNQAFGFNWDLIIDDIEPGKKYTLVNEEIYDNKGTRIRVDRHIAVAGHLVVRIFSPDGETHEIIKSGFGSQMWLPRQEFGDALKGARSDLVKTCAFQLGVALDLYWNERAEFDRWDTNEKKKASALLMEKIASGTPDTPVLLFSRAMSEYGMDGEEIASMLEVEFDEIMMMPPEEIKKSWEKIEKEKKKEKK